MKKTININITGFDEDDPQNTYTVATIQFDPETDTWQTTNNKVAQTLELIAKELRTLTNQQEPACSNDSEPAVSTEKPNNHTTSTTFTNTSAKPNSNNSA